MSSALRLGFAGTPRFAVPALAALLNSPHRVQAVFTRPDRPAGRGQTLAGSPIKQLALEAGITVLQPLDFKSAQASDGLRGLDLDALIVVAYGLILPPAVLALPRLGCINIHASLLPRWRGAAPIQRALLAGDCVTGVTLMRMEAGLDTGPMLAVREIAIGPRDTAATLHDTLAEMGAGLLVETLPALAAGTVHAIPQDPAGATYAAKIDKAEAMIDWREDATAVLRRVRAFNPWPVAETRLHGSQLRIWDAELGSAPARCADAPAAPGSVLAASRAGIDVACGTGVLRVLRLQLAGRRPLAAGEFIQAQRLSGALLAAS